MSKYVEGRRKQSRQSGDAQPRQEQGPSSPQTFDNAVPIRGLINDNPMVGRASSAVSESRLSPLGVIRRVLANRVEYQHNRRVETDVKGKVTKITAPIDISFGTDEHSSYFARERSLDQLTGLRTVRWEMDDDWWKAAYYHSYKGEALKGRAKNHWLPMIEKKGCKQMAPSDGHSISSDAKKKAPHFNAAWEEILNAALKKGTGSVENTEQERREEIAEAEAKAEKKRTQKHDEQMGDTSGITGIGFFENDPTEEYPGLTETQATDMGMLWKPQ